MLIDLLDYLNQNSDIERIPVLFPFTPLTSQNITTGTNTDTPIDNNATTLNLSVTRHYQPNSGSPILERSTPTTRAHHIVMTDSEQGIEITLFDPEHLPTNAPHIRVVFVPPSQESSVSPQYSESHPLLSPEDPETGECEESCTNAAGAER